MKEFLSFRKMVTPMIIQIIFWIGVVLCVIGGLVTVAKGATCRFGGHMLVLAGVLYIFLGPLVVRIYCELLIVMFRIHEELVAIRRGQASAPPTQ